MALFRCIDCKKFISERAFFCPNCGCPVNDEIVASVRKTEELKSQKEELKRKEKCEIIKNKIKFLLNIKNIVMKVKKKIDFNFLLRILISIIFHIFSILMHLYVYFIALPFLIFYLLCTLDYFSFIFLISVYICLVCILCVIFILGRRRTN